MGKRTDVHIGNLGTSEVLCGEGVYNIWAAVPDCKDPRVTCQRCLEISNGVRSKPPTIREQYDMLGRVDPLYNIKRQHELQARLGSMQQSQSLKDLQLAMAQQSQAMQNIEQLRNHSIHSQLFVINPGHNTLLKDLGTGVKAEMHHHVKGELERLAPIFKSKLKKPQKSHTLTKILFSAFFAIAVFGSVLFLVGRL